MVSALSADYVSVACDERDAGNRGDAPKAELRGALVEADISGSQKVSPAIPQPNLLILVEVVERAIVKGSEARHSDRVDGRERIAQIKSAGALIRRSTGKIDTEGICFGLGENEGHSAGRGRQSLISVSGTWT